MSFANLPVDTEMMEEYVDEMKRSWSTSKIDDSFHDRFETSRDNDSLFEHLSQLDKGEGGGRKREGW